MDDIRFDISHLLFRISLQIANRFMFDWIVGKSDKNVAKVNQIAGNVAEIERKYFGN